MQRIHACLRLSGLAHRRAAATRRCLLGMVCLLSLTWLATSVARAHDGPDQTDDPPTTSPVIEEIVESLAERPISEIRGVNYLRPTGYNPERCPDLQFGQDSQCPWDIAAIAADMARFETLGVNTVRIFLNYYTFGGASKTNPDYDITPAFAHLDTFIDVALQHDIYVFPVLLSKYPQDRFGAEHLETALRVHVRPVLRHLAARDGIIAWDMFNEPDIGSPVDQRCWDWANADYELCHAMANERLHFLRAVRQEIRLFDTERPITIGMAFGKSYFQPFGTDFFAADLVEFYSFHYYDNDPYDSGRYAEHWYYGQGFPADLIRALAELEDLNLGKPTLVSEIGFPTGPGHIRTPEEMRRDMAAAYQIIQHDYTSGVLLWPFQPEPETLIGDLFQPPEPATP